MAVRQATINRAIARILQGSTDPMWGDVEKGDAYADAVLRIWKELTGPSCTFFIKEATISGTSGVFTLPTDFYCLLRIQDDAGLDIPHAGSFNRISKGYTTGYKIESNTIVLYGYDTNPATITIKYHHYPKDMPDYDSDVTEAGDTYTPDYPLNSSIADRALAKLMQTILQAKSEEVIDYQAQIAKQQIDDFIELNGTRDRAGVKLPRPYGN